MRKRCAVHAVGFANGHNSHNNNNNIIIYNIYNKNIIVCKNKCDTFACPKHDEKQQTSRRTNKRTKKNNTRDRMPNNIVIQFTHKADDAISIMTSHILLIAYAFALLFSSSARWFLVSKFGVLAFQTIINIIDGCIRILYNLIECNSLCIWNCEDRPVNNQRKIHTHNQTQADGISDTMNIL